MANKINIEMGHLALKGWELGENLGNYNNFKALLHPDFNLFSHPLMGKSVGINALNTMENLINDRTKTPNNLTFQT